MQYRSCLLFYWLVDLIKRLVTWQLLLFYLSKLTATLVCLFLLLSYSLPFLKYSTIISNLLEQSFHIQRKSQKDLKTYMQLFSILLPENWKLVYNYFLTKINNDNTTVLLFFCLFFFFCFHSLQILFLLFSFTPVAEIVIILLGELEIRGRIKTTQKTHC